MKKQLFVIVVLTLLAALGPQFSTVFAQGSLAPPGAPGPTMKSLAQIEPRTPVATNTTPSDGIGLFAINQSGSYYMTASLIGVSNLHGIRIQANNVTLDLMGFTLQGVSNAFSGVFVGVGVTNIVIRNGTVMGWGRGGVDAYNGHNGYLERLFASQNGLSSGNFSGLAIGFDGSITDCSATANTGVGIQARDGSMVRNCVTSSNTVDGIQVSANCLVTANVARDNGNSGINATGARNRIEDNHVTDNLKGISVGTVNGANLVLKNSAGNNPPGSTTNNFLISTGNYFGNTNAISTGVITDTSPWRNFSY